MGAKANLLKASGLTVPSSTLIAILGAGLARRFGAEKLEALLHRQPLGLWPLQTARMIGASVAYVAGPQLPSFLLGTKTTTIINTEPKRGLGYSVALAAAHARSIKADRLVVMLGDMPFVSAETLQRLIGQASVQGTAACRYEAGRLGPPACFEADLFDKLIKLDGDKGARDLVRGAVAVDISMHELLDVDTAEQLAELNQRPPAG
jgi:CTP:molybdopterin cytidylyltransferase MocA